MQPPSYVVSMERRTRPRMELSFTAKGSYTEDEALEAARKHLAEHLEDLSTKAQSGEPVGGVEEFTLTIKGFDIGGSVISKSFYEMPFIRKDSWLMGDEHAAWRDEYEAARRTLATIALHECTPEAAYQLWPLLRRVTAS